ncbi:MAG: hypothetical protein WBH14_08890 [Albidovulum sp.]
MKRDMIALAFAVLVVLAAAVMGLPELLGAHPFWGQKTAAIGAAIGAGLACVLTITHVRNGVRIGIATGALAVAFACAKIGAARFAASYAEDAVAGQMWFLGWIGVAAGACLLIWSLAGFRRA